MQAEPEIILPGQRGAVRAGLSDAEIDRAEERLERLATLFDSAWSIPGTGIRFGADSVLGLIPGVGDVLGLAMAGYVVNEARRLGAPPFLVSRMAVNVGIDVAIGAVPFLGDVFDVYFKANKRNVALLRGHLAEVRRTQPRDVTVKRGGADPRGLTST